MGREPSEGIWKKGLRLGEEKHRRPLGEGEGGGLRGAGGGWKGPRLKLAESTWMPTGCAHGSAMSRACQDTPGRCPCPPAPAPGPTSGALELPPTPPSAPQNPDIPPQPQPFPSDNG